MIGASPRIGRRAARTAAVVLAVALAVQAVPAAADAPLRYTPDDPSDRGSRTWVRTEPLPGTVALTFDDGPDPEWTPIILDILKERGITATFFVLGHKVDQYPDLARRIVEEGHSLQNHAYHHHKLTVKTDAFVARMIDDCARAIVDATGVAPVCIRPPGGHTNARVERIAASSAHSVILWSPGGDSGDYAHHSLSGVLQKAAGWDAGDVTLMHDVWGWLHRDALPVIIADLQARGVGFSAICVPETSEEHADPTPQWADWPRIG